MFIWAKVKGFGVGEGVDVGVEVGSGLFTISENLFREIIPEIKLLGRL